MPNGNYAGLEQFREIMNFADTLEWINNLPEPGKHTQPHSPYIPSEPLGASNAANVVANERREPCALKIDGGIYPFEPTGSASGVEHMVTNS